MYLWPLWNFLTLESKKLFPKKCHSSFPGNSLFAFWEISPFRNTTVTFLNNITSAFQEFPKYLRQFPPCFYGISLLLFLGYPPNSFVGKSPIAFWKFPEYFPLHCQGLAQSPSMEIPTLSYRKFPLRLCRIFSFVGWFPSVFQAFPSWLPGPGGGWGPCARGTGGKEWCWLLAPAPGPSSTCREGSRGMFIYFHSSMLLSMQSGFT